MSRTVREMLEGRKAIPGAIQIVPYDPRYRDSTLEVAEQIHRTSVYADMPFDRNKLIQQLAVAGTVDNPERFFRLAVRDNQVLGGFYGVVMRVFFSSGLVAKDLGWWVREEARGGRAALLLLRAFEDWARERGAVKIGLGQTGVHDIERTTRLFEHCGYTVVGYNAMKDL